MSDAERTVLLSSQSVYDQPRDGVGYGIYSETNLLASEPSFSRVHHKQNEITFSRRISRFLSRFSWYNPHGKARSEYDEAAAAGELPPGAVKPPSLDSAWAYFEHVTLPRRLLRSGTKYKYTKARYGEDRRPTALYNVWDTPESFLSHFGESIGLYFFTLRSLSVILFIAGLINIPIIAYYMSDSYNHNTEGGLGPILSGTAICTDERWAPCPSCTRDQWDYFPRTFDRFAKSTDDSLRFIKVYDCRITYFDGLLSFFSLLFVFVSVSILCFYILKKREVEFDEAAQTTADYSVIVENPPKDARDAEEWRRFFSQFGHVTCCTVGVGNGELVRILAKRRSLVVNLSQLLPPGTKFNKYDLDKAVENALPLKIWQKLLFYSDAKSIHHEISEIDKMIEDIAATKTYDVCAVFVTFETEMAQHEALMALVVPRLISFTNRISALQEKFRFRGKHVLRVRRPPEPLAVRWVDLDTTLLARMFQWNFTSLVSFLIIVGGCILIRFCRLHHGVTVAALLISALNSIAPFVCDFIVEYESPHSEGSKQASRYFKTTAALWAFTALITSIVTPLPVTVSKEADAVIPSLYAIFICEMLRSPVIQLLDIEGNVYRHILGPRATDQEKMNVHFQGAAYDLSERYSNMTNILFLTFYYGTIFPAGFFFAAATLVIHYWTDKFCLLRSWARAPKLGTQISILCRAFVMMTIICYAVISSYNIVSFPFDNACEDVSVVTQDYVGTWTVLDGDGKKHEVTIESGDNNYFFCDQDMLRYKPPVFPAVPSNQPKGGEWMDQEQEHISQLYGWASVIVLAAVAAILLCKALTSLYRRWISGSYKPTGIPGEETFSETNIFGYIPQVRVDGSPFPYLVCDVSKIGDELIAWNNPFLGKNAQNLLHDVPWLLNENHLFSEVSHCPPPDVGREHELYEEMNGGHVYNGTFQGSINGVNGWTHIEYEDIPEWQVDIPEWQVERDGGAFIEGSFNIAGSDTFDYN